MVLSRSIARLQVFPTETKRATLLGFTWVTCIRRVSQPNSTVRELAESKPRTQCAQNVSRSGNVRRQSCRRGTLLRIFHLLLRGKGQRVVSRFSPATYGGAQHFLFDGVSLFPSVSALRCECMVGSSEPSSQALCSLFFQEIAQCCSHSDLFLTFKNMFPANNGTLCEGF